MRKTAEAGDHFMMPVRVVEKAFAARVPGSQRRKQGNRALLVGQGFAVLERQVDEQFFDG